MDLGFETIGNATLIAHDGDPVLVTDPWLEGTPYFGSWACSHEIPEEQMCSILQAPYVWISHGHPDHLSSASLEKLRPSEILLPDHYGHRIRDGLIEKGHKVRVLPDGKWVQLSRRLWVCCMADYNQDAVLLIRLGDRLIVNLNDAQNNIHHVRIRREVSRARFAYLLALTGYGDADMINLFNEDGSRIIPLGAEAKKRPLGPTIAQLTDSLGAQCFVPFSSMHVYQRTDSLWANEYTVDLKDYARGYDSPHSMITTPFVRVCCLTGSVDSLSPQGFQVTPKSPRDFGDDPDQILDAAEKTLAKDYFQSISHLHDFLDFIDLRVGGETHRIDFQRGDHGRGLAFEAPAHSFMTAIRYRVFDDMLIGNFMKTTLIGHWQHRSQLALSRDFTPYVSKYADNGGVRSKEELKKYFREYRWRHPLDFIQFRLQHKLREIFNSGHMR